MTIIGIMIRLHRLKWIAVGLINTLRWKFFRLFNRGTKLNFGCGPKPLPGYINIDASVFSKAIFIADLSNIAFLESDLYDEIRMDAFFEHLFRYEQDEFLSNVFRSLKSGGFLSINRLPNFEVCIQYWQDKMPGIFSESFDLFELYRQTHGEPQVYNHIYQMHKDLFTKKSITDLLKSHGFVIERIDNNICQEEPIPINLFITARKPAAANKS